MLECMDEMLCIEECRLICEMLGSKAVILMNDALKIKLHSMVRRCGAY